MFNSKKRLCLKWWCESLWNRYVLNFYVWNWENLSFLYYQFVTLNILGVVHATSTAECSCANGHVPCLLSGCISQNKCCLLFLGCFAHACALLVFFAQWNPFFCSHSVCYKWLGVGVSRSSLIFIPSEDSSRQGRAARLSSPSLGHHVGFRKLGKLDWF